VVRDGRIPYLATRCLCRRNPFVSRTVYVCEEERINQVIAGALPQSTRVDLDGLLREQQERTASVTRSALMHCPGTDWTRVANAITRLEGLRREN
jgi:hypothetical protein